MIHLSGKVQFRFVPSPFRADLRRFLTEFAEQHRGVRPGRMFGLPVLEVAVRRIAERQLTTPSSQAPSSQPSCGSWGVGRWELHRRRR